MKPKLKWKLAAVQVALALVLSLIGSAETQRRFGGTQEWGRIAVWDYVHPAEALIHIVNFPAVYLIWVIRGNASSQIGLEYDASVFWTYLSIIGVMWFSIGWWYREGLEYLRPRRAVAMLLSLAGACFATGILWTGVKLLQSPGGKGLYLPLAAVLWGMLILALCVRTMLGTRVPA